MLIMKLRRLAAMLIAAAMMVTFMPAMAFADDVPNVEKTTIKELSVKVVLPKCGDSAGNAPVVELGSRPEGVVTTSGSSWTKVENQDLVPFSGIFSGYEDYWLRVPLSYDTDHYAIPDTDAYRSIWVNGEEWGKGSGRQYIISMNNTSEACLLINFTPEHNWEDWTIEAAGASHKCSAQGCTGTETIDRYVIVDIGANHESLSEKARSEFGGIAGGEKNQIVCPWDSIHIPYDETQFLEISMKLPMVLEEKGILDRDSNRFRYYPYSHGDNSEALMAFAPESSYDTEESLRNDLEREAPRGAVVYALWAVEAKKGAFTVTPLTCSEEVSIETGEGLPTQKPKPVVNADPLNEFELMGEEYYNDFTYWLKSNPQESLVYEFLEGKIEGGREYTASFMIRPKFGFYCSADAGMQDESPDPVAPLDPGTLGTFAYDSNHGFPIRQLIPLNAAIEVNGKPEKAFIAWGLEEVPFVFANIAADHDWGPWTVTKEPTTSEDGEETRTCKICGARETRAIPKLPVVPVKQKKPLMATVRTKGKKSVRLSWNVMEDADGYDIFFARCNTKKKKYTCKYAGSVSGAKSTSWTKSSLKKGIPYKMYVKAYVVKDGKKSYFAKSPTVHAFASGSSKKYTNPKSVRVKKASAAIKAGKTYKIKASVVKLKKNKTLINTGHAPKLRYLSTDTSVATVSKSGKVKGKAAGSCKIYVYAVNGMKKAVKITVS